MDVTVQRTVTATPDRLMRALTVPAELTRWCCDVASVAEVQYLLRGASVPGAAMGGRLLEMTDCLLRYSWTLNGTTSQVTVELSPVATGTLVRLTHESIPKSALPGDRWEKDSWECVWTLYLRLLAGWVERGETLGRFDYTAPVQSLPFVRQLAMPAASERIWRALVDPRVRERWLTVPLGEELVREEGRRITFAWSMPEGPDLEMVTWELQEQGSAMTLVTLRHEGLPTALWDLEIGWHDYLVALYQEAVQ